MKRSDLFPRSRPGKVEQAQFDANQAAADKELLLQQLNEAGLMEAGRVYFQHFYVGRQYRNWLLPTEDAGDLKPAQVDHVLKNWGWYRTQLEKVNEYVTDQIPQAEA